MKILRILLKVTLILAFTVGCRGTEKKDDGSTDGKTSGEGKDAELPQTPDGSAGFNITVQPDPKYTYMMHRGTGIAGDDWSVPCKIDPTATLLADRNITCVVEAHELDLYFFGAGLRFNVPPSMCNYVSQSVPYFYKYEPGAGPANAVDNTNGTTTNLGVAAGSKTTTCAFDYSASQGPNCCEGNYTLYTYSDDSASVVDKVVSSQGKWGGKASACLDGPAMSIAKGFTTTGYPLNTLFFVEGVGINVGYFIPSSIGKLYNTNLFSANYFVAADHVGGTPLMSKKVGYPSTQVYHEYFCLDRAKEISASIRVMIREWNTVSDLVLGAAGNPDIGGADPSGIGSNNDYADLKDLGEFYPGAGL